MRGPKIVAIGVGLAVALVACGGGGADDNGARATTSPSAAAGTDAPPADQIQVQDRVTIEVSNP